MEVIIRPLELADAEYSWRWRNDPEIWKYTGSRPDKIITAEIEREWIAKVIDNKNEKRFAICVGSSREYIGNIQLTDIEAGESQYHIFIGNKAYWGKGIAQAATKLILQFAFEKINLDEVYLFVHHENLAAIEAYLKCGFKIVAKNLKEIKMNITKKDSVRAAGGPEVVK